MTVTGRHLKPITREALKRFYAEHPLQPVPEAADEHVKKLTHLSEALRQSDERLEQLAQRTHFATPTRIDDCFWRTRQLCEEVALALGRASNALKAQGADELALVVDTSKQQLLAAEMSVRKVQEQNTAAATKQIKQFLPKDFRSSMLEMRQAHQEAKNQKAVDDLVKRGGSIRDKYDLYLKQQWARRESLAQFGNLSGMYAAFVKLLAGIPQVLLDFAKEINAKQGPMEEQRIKYGPDFYKVATLGIQLTVLTTLWAEALQKGQARGVEQQQDIVQEVAAATELFTAQLVRVAEFIGELFVKSPFFLSADDDKEPIITSRTGSGTAKAAATAGTSPAKDGTTASSTQGSQDGLAGVSSLPAGRHQHAAPGHQFVPAVLGAVLENKSMHMDDACTKVVPHGAAAVGRTSICSDDAASQRSSHHHAHHHGHHHHHHLVSVASLTSDCWMSADDNHSWYEPSTCSCVDGPQHREGEGSRSTLPVMDVGPADASKQAAGHGVDLALKITTEGGLPLERSVTGTTGPHGSELRHKQAGQPRMGCCGMWGRRKQQPR